MRPRIDSLTMGIALILLGTGSLRAQSENDQLRRAKDLTLVPSPAMADFLRSEAAKTHCCTTEDFLEGAVLYKRAAEHGLDGKPENLEAAIQDLRLAGYFFYYAGEFNRAFNTIARVGTIELDRGNRKEAARAFLEAAHVARWSGNIERARDLLLASQELDPEAVDVANKP